MASAQQAQCCDAGDLESGISLKMGSKLLQVKIIFASWRRVARIIFSPIVDVSFRLHRPTIYRINHPVLNLFESGDADRPNVWPIRANVRQDPTGVVGDLNSV